MRDTIKQIIIVLLSIVLWWPISMWVVRGMVAVDGSLGAPILTGVNPLSSMIYVVAGALVLGIISLVAGKLTHRYTGMLVYGFGWVIVARFGVTTDDLLRALGGAGWSSGGIYFRFAIEDILWAIPAGIMVYAQAKLSPSRYEDEDGKHSIHTRIGFLITLCVSFIACYLFARSFMRGQSVLGVAAAIALTVMAVRLAWPRCNGSVLFAVPVIVGVLGHLTCALFMKVDTISLQTLEPGTIWPHGRLLPLDYIGAGVFGIALGIGLARSFGVEPEIEQS